jgi:hypothetical protein
MHSCDIIGPLILAVFPAFQISRTLNLAVFPACGLMQEKKQARQLNFPKK